MTHNGMSTLDKQRSQRPWISRRNFFRSVSATILGAGFWTWLWEPHWVEFFHRALPVTNLPPHLHGTTLVHLSDIHIGPRVSDSFLLETFAQINRLNPAFVVYTGDFTSYEHEGLAHAVKMFPKLPHGKLGTFGILGNHDYGIGWQDYPLADRLARIATDSGVNILRNQMAEASGLQLIGMDDMWAKRFQPAKSLSDLNSRKPAIVLAHSPDTVDLPGWDGFEGWILAGHTHGGQCKPPFLPAPLLPVKNRRYTAGAFDLSGNRRLYINRGLGHLLQVRFNVRPEVTVFNLQPA